MTRPLRYVIMGAGMAGMLAAIRLLERGETNFIVYEKGDAVGGTWRENHYPGLACDTPAHSYTYSFALNPDWSAFYAPGPEIRAYFEHIAERYGLAKYIVLNSAVTACRFQDGQWHVETSDGRRDTADVVIAATGVLHHPNIPDLPGLDNFTGAVFHSARWDHSVETSGKRVGVIGTGSTGVQIVSALSKEAVKLVHFMRSPQWIMPAADHPYSEAERQAFRDDPAKIEEVRNGPDAAARRARFTAAIIDKDSPELAEIQQICEKNLDDSVRDPALREKLRPDYLAACKRLVFSSTYYDAVQQPGVEVERGAIDRIEPTGIRMKDGTFYDLDVIALATGFKVDQFVRPMVVEGPDGQSLDALWAKNPRAYYAVAVPGFPNFFLLNGPTGPVGNFTLIDIAEAQWDYIDQLIDQLRSCQAATVAPTMAALKDYETRRSEAAKQTVFASGCNSWYLDADGVPLVWPWSYAHFREVMAKPRFEDFELTA